VLLAAACARPVRVETREQPVDTGVEVPFSADGPRRWDFGDGSAPASGLEVRHAFQRAGTYRVQGFEGERLREQVTVVVHPRGVFRLVPPDVQWAVVARGLEELAPAIDFVERLAGANVAQRWLEAHPLVAWALEQSGGREGPLDPRQGLAHFAWPDDEGATVTVVGVWDGAAAIATARSWLVEHGWSEAGAVAGLHRFEREGDSLDLFVDRGALYAVETSLTARRPGAQARVAAMSALGLEADGPTAEALDALPSGGLALYGRGPGDVAWRFATGALRIGGEEARLEGRVHAPGPLWQAPAEAETRFLSRAPEGPVVVASAALRPEQLAALLLGTPGSPRRKALDAEFLAQGADLQRVVQGFGGLFEAAVYFDVVGFVRGTLASGGRPSPEATVLLEAPVVVAEPVEALVDAWSAYAGVRLEKAREKQLRLWRGGWAGRPLELALTSAGLYGRLGAPVGEREAVDLLAELSRRFEGAFTQGHVSLFVDVGQLRRELLTPRRISDVDPRRAITAQALAVTFLDQLTTLDVALLDVEPVPSGAAVQAVLRLRPPR
jgi:hypothetical protein